MGYRIVYRRNRYRWIESIGGGMKPSDYSQASVGSIGEGTG